MTKLEMSQVSRSVKDPLDERALVLLHGLLSEHPHIDSAKQEGTEAVSFGAGYKTYDVAIRSGKYERPLRIAIGVPITARCSIDPEAASESPDPAMVAYERECGAFERMLPSLTAAHEGKFVAILDCRVVDSDAEELTLAERAYRNHRGRFVLIRRVGEEDLVPGCLDSPEVEA